MNYEHTAKIFKALGDSNRLQIMDILKDGEKCACQLLDLLHIGQSTLSHQMKILCDSSLVTAQKEGKWMHYTLNKTTLQQTQKIILSLEKK